MKTMSLLGLLCFGFFLSAQETAPLGKGVFPISSLLGGGREGVTRAVVVGISDYFDDQIPDLKYADKDAEAFIAWLQSPAGGLLTSDQVVLLTNEKATTPQFSAALDWLIEQSKEGDQAIIYFSGHGDVETKTIINWGFLLTYDSPPNNYIAGAFLIAYLQSVVSTLAQKNVKVVMISDACHAGKLAGSEYGGTQATALNLSKQFANEVKIMSCQPDEFSMEGEQWGGGRGAFSYHLIEGLTGLADKNIDGMVKLLEIENYLEEILPEETAPHSQIPMTVGSKSNTVALVDTASLTALKQRKSTEMPTLAKIETKGFEKTVLEKVDTSVQELYAAFLSAVERGDLLEPAKAGSSANDLYEQLIQEESLAPLHGFMKRNLAAALHDKAQVVLNSYLKSDTAELSKRWRLDSSYFWYPQYLSRAAELLGEEHYMYRNLRGKQYYFEGLLIRLQRDFQTTNKGVPWDTTMTAKALELQHKALEYETRAAFIYHELGNLYRGKANRYKALEYSRKSAELSPNWGLTLHYYGNDLIVLGRNEEGIEIYKKALKVAPHYHEIYYALGWAYQGLYRYDEAQIWFDKALKLNDAKYFPYQQGLAWFYIRLSEFEKAESLGRKLLSISDSNKWVNRQNSLSILGYSLDGQRKSEEALEIFELLAETADSTNRGFYLALTGLEKIELGQHEEGLAIIEVVLDSKPSDASLNIFAGQGYLKLKRYEAAASYYVRAMQEARKMNEAGKLDKAGFYSSIYELVWTHAFENETALALQWLETILQEGYDDYERLQHDRVLEEMRNTQKFKDLMREYFPTQFKD